jgi:hypothetical protein
VLDQGQSPVADAVAAQVDFLEKGTDCPLEEGLHALAQQFVVLQVDAAQVLVGLDVAFEGGSDGGLDEVLAEVERDQVQPVDKQILCTFSLDEVFRYLEFFQLLVLLERDGDYFGPVDADVVVLEPQDFDGLVLEEDGSEATSAVDAERVLADGPLLDAEVKGA